MALKSQVAELSTSKDIGVLSSPSEYGELNAVRLLAQRNFDAYSLSREVQNIYVEVLHPFFNLCFPFLQFCISL